METQFNFKELFHFATPYTRKRYWGTVVIGFVANVVLALVLAFLTAVFPLMAIVTFVISLAFWWVFYATTIKRLRDADMNLWWALTLFLPGLNLIAFIVFGCIGSKEPKNFRAAKPVVVTGVVLALMTFLIPVLIIVAGLIMMNANGGAGRMDFGQMPIEKNAPAPETAPATAPAPAPAEPEVAPQVEEPRGQ